MKKILIVLLTLVLCVAFAVPAFATGNGAMSGSHYNLNIIGVDKDKKPSMTGSSGHTIFVPLYGKTRILLQQGADFQVLDRNGTNQPIADTNPLDTVDSSADGTAIFQLPTDLYTVDGVCKYYVFARALGKPKGNPSATIQPGYYYTDLTGTWYYLSTVTVPLSRTTGKPKFADVTNQLMYVYVDYNLDGTVEKIPLFSNYVSPNETTYFWDYMNSGLKLTQLRFYPVGQ